MTAGRAPLFFQERFWPMWVTLSLGTFADNILRQALLIGIPFGIISVPLFTNPDDAIPVIGALLPAAIMIFSSVSGQLADKYETSMMFRRTKFSEIILMTISAFAFASGAGLLAILTLFLMGAQSAFYAPVRVGAMPKYLETNELVRGNGLCNAGLFTFILLGYGVGGFLIVQESGGAKVGVTLVLVAFAGWLASLRAQTRPANAPDLKLNFNPFGQTYRMFKFVFESRGVAPPLIGIASFYFVTTAVTVLVPLFARDTLNSTPLVATALNGLFAVGAGLGAITAASLSKGRASLGVSTLGVMGAGVLTLFAAIIGPAFAAQGGEKFGIDVLFTTPLGVLITVTFVLSSALMGLYIAPLQAALQRRAPHDRRSRIMAASTFANALFAIPGSLSILFITRTGLPPEAAFIGIAVAMLLIGATMIYRRRKLSPGLYDEMLAAPANVR